MLERLDHDMLEDLKVLMEEDFCALLEVYLKDSELRFFELSEAWEAGDLERLLRSAHGLKGASSNIGAAELASLCDELERLARARRADRLPDMLAQVQVELREVRDAVEVVRHAH